MKNRRLLCIPYGGLNDALVQIAKCYEYANKYRRDLYIDTRNSGIFLDFDTFFGLRNRPSSGVEIVPSVSNESLLSLNQIKDVLPAEFAGQLESVGLQHVVTPEYKGYTFSDSGLPTTFDFSCDHPQELLVHLNCGGGIQSHDLMPHLRLAPQASVAISRHLRTLPGSYVAIHVRHTDLKTDYQPFLSQAAQVLEGQSLLVCSDSLDVIEDFRQALPGVNLLWNPDLCDPPTGKTKCLHARSGYGDDAQLYKATMMSLQDLFALAMSDELMILKHQNNWYSGFSRLAYFLHQNKQVALQMMATSA